MSHIQMAPDVRVHIDQLQVTAVSPGGNKDANEAAETSTVNVIDATHIGLHVFMVRRKARYRCLELDRRFEDEAAAADQSRRAFGDTVWSMLNERCGVE